MSLATLSGSTLSSPFRADQRGTLATVSDPDEIARQAILAVLQTRQGERVMLPDFGLPDFMFSVVGAGFAARLAYHVETQARRYVRGVEVLNVTSGLDDDGRVEARITWKRTGAREPLSLVFPIWRFRS